MSILYDPNDYFYVFTVEEAANYLKVESTRVVAGWVKEGKLKGKKVGRRWLITRAALKEFVNPEEPKPPVRVAAQCPIGIQGCMVCATRPLPASCAECEYEDKEAVGWCKLKSKAIDPELDMPFPKWCPLRGRP